MDDSLIIGLFFMRSEEAIKETEKKYGKVCKNIALRMTGNSEDAEECVNDALMAAWSRIPPEKPENFGAWLVKVTRNLACNMYNRKNAEKRKGDRDLLEEEFLEAIPDVNDSALCELRWDIEAFLFNLPKKDRILFMRRYFYGDTMPELAELLGSSENTLSVRLMRIRKKLYVFLEKGGGQP